MFTTSLGEVRKELTSKVANGQFQSTKSLDEKALCIKIFLYSLYHLFFHFFFFFFTCSLYIARAIFCYSREKMQKKAVFDSDVQKISPMPHFLFHQKFIHIIPIKIYL